MRVVYRNLLEVRSPALSAEETTAKVVELLHDWVRAGAAKYSSAQPPELLTGTHELVGGVAIRVDSSKSHDGKAEVHTLRYSHPDKKYDAIRTPGLVWTTECRVSRLDGEVELDTTISCGYSDYRIAPLDVPVGAPKFLKQIVSDFDCFRSGVPIYGSFKLVEDAGVDNLVKNMLMENRILPYVIVSPRNEGGYLLRPEELAQEVAGLGVVYALADETAVDKLVEKVGRQHAVFDGAVRICYPGFSLAGNRYRNPLITRGTLESAPGGVRKVMILRQLAFAASSLNWKGRFEEARKKILLDDRSRLLAQIKGADNTAQLTEFANRLLEKVRQLEDERDQAIANLQSVHTMYQVQEEVLPPAFAGDSVLEAIEYSQIHHSKLWIWPDAFTSARGDTSERGEEVHRILVELNLLAQIRQETGGELGKPLIEHFRETGLPFKYSDHEREETIKKYKSDYTFEYQSIRLEARRHFRIGSGSVDNVVQVFWEFEPAGPRIIVFHAGRHLPTDSWVS